MPNKYGDLGVYYWLTEVDYFGLWALQISGTCSAKEACLPMQFDSSQKIVLEREVLHWAVNLQKAQLVPQPYAHGGGLVTFAEYWCMRTEAFRPVSVRVSWI